MMHWGDGLEEGYLKVYPARLIIYRLNLPSDKNIIWFQLSHSHQLSPNELRYFHYDGSAKVKFSKKKCFQFTEDFSATFINRYQWINDGKKRNITFPELIAEAEFQNPIEAGEVEDSIKLFDDFLLLVSYAEGHRVTLPRIQVYYPDSICNIYRMNYSIPKLPDNHNFNCFRIYRKDFDNFIKKTWGTYQKSKHRELLKAALISQVTDVQRSMESRYLSIFSGIETLLLCFRLENDLELVVCDNNNWNRLKKQIKKSIKNQDIVELDKEQKEFLYNNLNSLNRIPLNRVFEIFANTKGLAFDDLWNFTGSSSEYSLTTLRNRLIHGHGITPKFIADFSVASENLKLYAQRMLLADLGWRYEKSRAFRKDDTFVEEWKLARERITNWK